ncbi:hypothetical protein Nepgr_031581 [Nepenthes gracilis]|uniref:Uncharacterized protein n=1 Tax=Nepenthes gracilis TaxID=150966 RepID=A0AAD3TIS1_NEPGR|nr:hypothetical protein Nepgr_031581 [Nepenthes gracilis]
MDELWKNPSFATHAFAAAGSVTLGTALTYPLDAIKTIIQVSSSSRKQFTSTQVIDRILSLSGPSGLYSGFGWSTFGRITSLGARFGTYEVLTAFYKDGREDNYVYVYEALLAGIAAGAVESLISSPFELFKLRAQVTSATRAPTAMPSNRIFVAPMSLRLLHRNVLDKKALAHSVSLLSVLTSSHQNLTDALKNYPWMMTGSGKLPAVSDVRHPLEIVRLEGVGALWRSLRAGVVRDSIFGGVFFSMWQFLHLAILNWKAVQIHPPPLSDDDIGPLSPLEVSLAAGFSGSAAAAASHGFDTARCRSQCTVLPKFVSMERRFLRWKRPGNLFERVSGIHPADRNILFRGILLRMARSGFASFMIVGSYFLAVDHLLAK